MNPIAQPSAPAQGTPTAELDRSALKNQLRTHFAAAVIAGEMQEPSDVEYIVDLAADVAINEAQLPLAAHATLTAERDALKAEKDAAVLLLKKVLAEKTALIKDVEFLDRKHTEVEAERDRLRDALEWCESTALNIHLALQSTAAMDPNDSRIAFVTGRAVSDLLALRTKAVAACASTAPSETARLRESNAPQPLQAEAVNLHTTANRIAELFSAQYLRANNDGGRVAHAMKQMNAALAALSARAALTSARDTQP